MKKILTTLIIYLALSASAIAAPILPLSDQNDYLGFAPWANGYRLNIAEFNTATVEVAPFATSLAQGVSGIISIELPDTQVIEFSTSVLNLTELNKQGFGIGANYRFGIAGTNANVGLSITTTDQEAINQLHLPQIDAMQINGRLEF